MANKNRIPMRVDPAFKDLVKSTKLLVQSIEKAYISERELTRRIGQSEKVKAMIIEDSKRRSIKK